MNPQAKVFVLVLSGEQRDALAFVDRHYPACAAILLSKTALREGGWKSQVRQLRQLKGQALFIFADSLATLREPLLLKWATLLHRCRETVMADSSGALEITTKVRALALLPRTLLAALADGLTFAFSWIFLQLFQEWLRSRPEPKAASGPLDLAFLFPWPGGLETSGGAFSHITGFLSGVAKEGARAAVFSGQRIQTANAFYWIPGSRSLHLFREAAILSYNIRFIIAARKFLAKKRARLLYQRHGRFLFAGAVLSRLMRIPLVLEYNASEEWMAKYWDPTRFSPWLRLCEKISVRAAALITVVSGALKRELVQAGVPAGRILVNPNAVDPEEFHPQSGGAELRIALGLLPEDIAVCFVGTFSYWHGVSVLGRAIHLLVDAGQSASGRLKFLLVGNGPFAAELRSELEPYVKQGSVIFTGNVPHKSVRTYLDAADILVSPHVPMPGGTPFFGSPTKLFEYMAMGKAIAASALDQIAEVLEHGKTALLVTPGAAEELAGAIRLLAANPELRTELGRNARETALARHTWRQNARRVLAHPVSNFAPSRESEQARRPASQAGRSNLAKQNP